MHSWDLLSPWFSTSDKSSPIAGGVPTPATIFPLLREDLVDNHASLGVTPKHGYVNPMSSQGHPSQIRRYRALHPGQLSTRSSRGLILAPNQHSIGSSQGHTLSFFLGSILHFTYCSTCISSPVIYICTCPNY